MHGKPIKPVQTADMIPVRMRDRRHDRKRSQTFGDRADIGDPHSRIDQKGPFPAADKIAARFLPMSRLTDRKRIGVDLIH